MATQPPKKSPAQELADGILNPVKFYVRKKAVRPMLHALTGTQPNPYQPQGSLGMQDRTDLSGKFMRRLSGIRRALSRADELVVEDRQALTKIHGEKYPAFEADGVTPHPKAGEYTPVYALEADQKTPVFKKDKAGNDTEERVILVDQYNVPDMQAFEKEFKALLNEFIVVECVGFTEDDFNAFKAAPQQNMSGKVIDMLSDLLRGNETEATPEEQAKALEARAAAYVAEAERIRKQDAAPGLALVTDEPAVTSDQDEGPQSTAP